MAFQFDYRGGPVPVSTGFIKCPRCLDVPNPQFKLIVLPADPPALVNTRPENYVVDETNWLNTQNDEIITTESAVPIITNIPNPGDVASTVNLKSTIKYHSGSLTTVYLDLLTGQTAATGKSALLAITGSATRPNIASQVTAVKGIAVNTQAIVITASSLVSNVNINYAAIYSAATAGSLLASGPVSVLGRFIQMGSAVQFNALGISININ